MNAALSTREFHDDAGALSLRIFGQIPPGHLAFTVSDHGCEPLIRPGEVAIIDITDREPVDGWLFLRRFDSTYSHSKRLAVVEAIFNCGRSGNRTWILVDHNRPRTAEEITRRLAAGLPIAWADGPFADDGEYAWYVRDRIVGKVIGVLSGSTQRKFLASQNEASTACRDAECGPPTEIAITPLLRPSQIDSEGNSRAAL